MGSALLGVAADRDPPYPTEVYTFNDGTETIMRRFVTTLCLMLMLVCSECFGQRQMEWLDRGVVAVRTEEGVFVGWRLLGTEPHKLGFDVFRETAGRKPVKLTRLPITGATHIIDTAAKADMAHTYRVQPVGKDQSRGGSFTLQAGPPRPYQSIPLKTHKGYVARDCSAADLDGDGQYEIILHQRGRGKDSAHDGMTDPPIIQAYKLDGTLMWEINLGPNIREGSHYTQFMVYDLDGNGYAEMVVKTADGTVDGKGKVIGDPKANYVMKNGRILSGPEYLTVFDGRTGAAMDTVDYVPLRGITTHSPTSDQLHKLWGDGYGNRVNRFLACVAYLDGVRPSVVMCRGYYTRTFLVAWDYKDGKLKQRWVFDSQSKENKGKGYCGQGNHSVSVADVDQDGKDEIVYGGMTVDHDGTGLFTTRLGHGDAMHVSDLDPTRPGLEMFRIQEPFSDAGAHMVDAKTGEILWKIASVSHGKKKEGPGRGVSLDIDPRYPGSECWVAGAGILGLYSAKGEKIAEGLDPKRRMPTMNMGVWWDGDVLRELLDNTKIEKWNWNAERRDLLLNSSEFGCVNNSGTKATPCLSADILGDWREEVIWPTKDGKELRIFTTTIPTKHRFYTFMHDPQYRLSIAWQNVTYNQPPHTSFALRPTPPAPPNIKLVQPAATSSVQPSP
ncbi:rhamnogalacturonan lyase [Candidatus Sumerlaeota bacterium]